MLNTSYEWIDKLAKLSKTIDGMQLRTCINDVQLNQNARNLANCEAHCHLISRAMDEFVNNGVSTTKNARELLLSVIGKNTYGSFAELAAYDWFIRNQVKITTQVRMQAKDVLSLNETVLDGRIDYHDTYFDVKAFGFNGHLANRLKNRLAEELPGEQIHVEDTWDISCDDFSKLVERAKDIADELRKHRMVQRGNLRIRLAKKELVSISTRTVDPYLLAKENALYPFKDAKQFTRNRPFILVFIIHPWFNGSVMGPNFSGNDAKLTRSLARRAFMQFSADTTFVNTICDTATPGVTLAEASRLLSAIFFVNVWPAEANASIEPPYTSWLYSNPRALYPITNHEMSLYSNNFTELDSFINDNY